MKTPDPDTNTLSTPEGDNEFAPDEPLSPDAPDAQQIPPGYNQTDANQAYKQDVPLATETPAEPAKPEGLEKFIDEIVRGEYM
jgi:hypothetical protein